MLASLRPLMLAAMEDAAVEEAKVSGAPAVVAVTRLASPSPSPGRLPSAAIDESCPPREFTAEEKEASSSSSSEKAPMPGAPPEDPAPAPTQGAKKKERKTKKKVIMPQSRLDNLMKVEEWEPLPPIDEEWLKKLAALIPDGEQFFADRGFTVEKYRELDDMSFAMKAQKDLAAELQERLQEKGYVEMEVTDDDEEEARAPAAGRSRRRRFRPGVSKKPGGEIKKLN